MLVVVDRASIKSKGMLSLLTEAPSFEICIASSSGSSVTVIIRGHSSKKIGLAHEIDEAEEKSARAVVTVKGETVQIPITLGTDRIEASFKTAKYKGKVRMRVSRKNYFTFFEVERINRSDYAGDTDISSDSIVHLSSLHSIKKNMIKRTLYDGNSYKVNPRTFETTEYSEILKNPSILEAHRYTKSLFENEDRVNSKEDEEFIKKIRFLRSSPKMFISIFFHVSLEVSRNSILYSFYKVYANPYYKKDLHKKITIKFIGELGEDHGALRKEFFELAGNEIVCDSRFTRENGLFDLTMENTLKELGRKRSTVLNISDTDFYSFVGFFLGHVIFQQVQINVRFSKTFYMALLKRKCDYNDISDPAVKASIEWIRDNPASELGFIFKSGEPVTDQNKDAFISEYIYEETYLKRPGYANISHAFHKIVSEDILAFNPNELERLFSGVPIIPLEYLKRISMYKSCDETTQEIVNFWHIMKTSTEEFRKEILRFITGSSSIQYIPGSHVESIMIEYVDIPGSLPTAHTCFRRLVLYKYASLEEQKSKLEMAVKENSGFQFI